MPRATKLQQGKNGKLASKRSKTGDPKCSAAASAFARGQATSDTYKILGECRSRARMKGQANLQREAGNEAKAQVLDKRADRGLTGAQRIAKAKELIASRKAKIDARMQAKAAPAPQAKAEGRGTPERQAAARAMKYFRSDEPARASQGDNWAARGKRDLMATHYGGAQDAVIASRQRREAKRGQRQAEQANAEKLKRRLAERLDRKANGVTVKDDFGFGTGEKITMADAVARKRADLARRRADRAQGKVDLAREKRYDRLPADKAFGFGSNAQLARSRASQAAELRAQRAAKAAPAKPDRLARLGATDPKVKAMLAERRSAKAAELRQQRAAKAAPAPATAARPSRSTPERQARVEAAKDRLFGRRLDRAFTKLDAPKGSNFQGLDKVRAALPYKAEEFNQRLRSQRQSGRYSLDSFEGAAERLPASLKAAAIQEGKTRFTFISRRDAEPYTPRKAALPAIKSGLPTTKGGVPAETPKMSLLEQARIRRAYKNLDGNRAGRLAARAQKRYQAARRNMQTNTKKGNLDRAVKYATAANANAGRLEKLVAIHTSGGKFAKARVVN